MRLTSIDKYKLPKLPKHGMAIIVWILRFLIGGLFLFAGFSKAVDPWGFYYKIVDYLRVWDLTNIPESLTLCVAVILSAMEFTLGSLLILGCLRRAVCWCILAFMAVMLPLTGYIALYSPVDDCGCFGDAWVIGNTATFLKNLAITIGTIWLLKFNKSVSCVINPMSQWMAATAGILYCLTLSFIGYSIQPLYDFRPYKTGTSLIEDSKESTELIYEKNDIRQTFTPDSLPDDSWTYISRKGVDDQKEASTLAIYDGEDDVTEDVIQPEGRQMLLVINDPSKHSRTRAYMANHMSELLEENDGTFTALLGMPADSLALWKEEAQPEYEVYNVDDTSLKSLVRGEAALVYLKDGIIQWKRNLYSFSADFPETEKGIDQFDYIQSIDNGSALRTLTYIYLAILCIIYLISLIKLRKTPSQEAQTKNAPKELWNKSHN